MARFAPRRQRTALHFLAGDKNWFWHITLAALLVRCAFFWYPSGDYTEFLRPWFEELRAAGGLAGIGRPIGDYMTPYLYILALLTYLPLPSIVSIKMVSCLGDIALALYGMRAAKLVTKDALTARAVYTALLFLPTVWLNSGAWGQCDSLYTAALLACLCGFLQQRPGKAALAYGVALAFKLQAVFLAPLLILLWVKRKVKLRHLLWVPAVYLLAILPAFVCGRPLSELLTIYLRQTGTYTQLSMGAPNLYAWLRPGQEQLFTVAGVALSGAAVAATVFFLSRKSGAASGPFLLNASYLFVLMLPYLLPRMHERYFYPADVFSVLYFFSVPAPKQRRVAAVTVLCSFFTTCRFLFGWSWVQPAWLSLPLLWALVTLYRAVMKPTT